MNETLTIDAENRIINIPKDYIIGVESDEKANRIQFQCPRKIGNGMSLTNCAIYINYRNANKDVDRYICDSALVTDTEMDTCTFEWEIPRKVCAYKGYVYFVVCAILSDENGTVLQEWNTTLARATVLEGLEAEPIDPDSDTYDIIQQLIRMGSEATQKARQAADECITYSDRTLQYSIEAKQAASSVPTIDDASVAVDKVWSSDKVNSVMDPANTPYMASAFYNDLTTENVCYMLQTRNVVLTNDMSVTVSEGVTSTVDISETLVTPVIFIKTKDGNFACIDGNGVAYTGSYTIETGTSFTATITAKYAYISRDMFDDDVIEELDSYAVLEHYISDGYNKLSTRIGSLDDKVDALIDDTSTATDKTWSASKIGEEVSAASYKVNLLVGTANAKSIVGQAKTNQCDLVAALECGSITNLESGAQYTISCDITANAEGGTATLQWDARPWGFGFPSMTLKDGTTHAKGTFTYKKKDTDAANSIQTRMDNVPATTTVTVSKLMLVKGSQEAEWVPNPKDYLLSSALSTTLSDSSTDSTVPSSKAVYDAIANNSGTGSGGTSIDDTSTTATNKTWSASKIYTETAALESNVALLSTKVSTLEANSDNVTPFCMFYKEVMANSDGSFVITMYHTKPLSKLYRVINKNGYSSFGYTSDYTDDTTNVNGMSCYALTQSFSASYQYAFIGFVLEDADGQRINVHCDKMYGL